MVRVNSFVWALLLFTNFLANSQPLAIRGSSVFVPSCLGSVELSHNNGEFNILKDGKQHPVQNCFIDKGLRKVDSTKLAAFLQHGYISVNQVADDEFSLKANVRGPGGGAFGAWLGATFGKIAVSTLGHGTIYLIGMASGPAAPFTIAALEASFGPVIESTSVAAAAACGIALAVATGPV